MTETKSSSRRPLSEEAVECAAATNAIRRGLASRCCSAEQSQPIYDGLVEPVERAGSRVR